MKKNINNVICNTHHNTNNTTNNDISNTYHIRNHTNNTSNNNISNTYNITNNTTNNDISNSEINKKYKNKPDDVQTLHTRIHVKNMDGLCYLRTYISNNSIDLILTDPPYIISRESGMNTHYNNVKNNIKNNIKYIKNEKEWAEYKLKHNIQNDKNKEKYMKYGSVYGTKYCVKTHYGDWDANFTMEILEQYIAEFYNKLRIGGSIILFFDLWKITPLKTLLEKYKFKQIRFIEWIKTNPQPRNSKINYLTNCREIALTAVKKSKPTFNSCQDNGIYFYPFQTYNRQHCTQKSLKLFEELIRKHSNENDVVLDTFLGSGTTLIACKNTKRRFKGCEISRTYFDYINQFS